MESDDKGVMALPTIIIDTREQRPLIFNGLHIRGVKELPTVRHKLNEGDYSVVGFEDKLFIERKSPQDLYGTLFQGRERFERELERAKGYKYKYLVVEDTPFGFAQYMEYHRNLKQFNSAFSTLMTYAERYGIKVRWAKSADGAATYVARLAIKVLAEESKIDDLPE